VEADQLATEYMQEDLIRPPNVTLFPSAKAQFLIEDVSVTRKIPQSIRYAAGSKPIRTYLIRRKAIGLNKHLRISTRKLTVQAIPIIVHSGVTLSSYAIGTYR
jgi:hypothetical protein